MPFPPAALPPEGEIRGVDGNFGAIRAPTSVVCNFVTRRFDQIRRRRYECAGSAGVVRPPKTNRPPIAASPLNAPRPLCYAHLRSVRARPWH